MTENRNVTANFDSPEFRKWLVGLLQTEDCTISFTKADGTTRTMKCTLRKDVTEQYELKGGWKKTADILAVWDLEENGWRSFRYDSLISVNFTLGAAHA